jgi:hypothetical protein
MPGTYEIELSEPSSSRCDCCGGLTVRLTRFVYRDGDAFAVYYAAYANNHPDSEVAILVSLGEWGEGSEAADRAAFLCLLRPTEGSYEVMLGDAARSHWRDAETVGKKLSREEALGHPWKATAFEVLDEAALHDPSLRGFICRAQGHGGTAEPLEHSFGMPDEVFALGDDRTQRAEIRRNFVSLDGARFFVRCLLSIPVEGYDAWSVGLWVEVARTDYEWAWNAWEDPSAYPALHFSGTLANDLAELDLPLALGAALRVHVPDPDSVPVIAGGVAGDLAPALTKRWSRRAFEEYAVARGYL